MSEFIASLGCIFLPIVFSLVLCLHACVVTCERGACLCVRRACSHSRFDFEIKVWHGTLSADVEAWFAFEVSPKQAGTPLAAMSALVKLNVVHNRVCSVQFCISPCSVT